MIFELLPMPTRLGWERTDIKVGSLYVWLKITGPAQLATKENVITESQLVLCCSGPNCNRWYSLIPTSKTYDAIGELTRTIDTRYNFGEQYGDPYAFTLCNMNHKLHLYKSAQY